MFVYQSRLSRTPLKWSHITLRFRGSWPRDSAVGCPRGNGCYVAQFSSVSFFSIILPQNPVVLNHFFRRITFSEPGDITTFETKWACNQAVWCWKAFNWKPHTKHLFLKNDRQRPVRLYLVWMLFQLKRTGCDSTARLFRLTVLFTIVCFQKSLSKTPV